MSGILEEKALDVFGQLKKQSRINPSPLLTQNTVQGEIIKFISVC